MNWKVTVVLVACVLPFTLADRRPPPATRVMVYTDRLLQSYEPAQAWGAAIDGHDYSRTSTVYSRANIAAMKSAGLGPITYRLRSELAIEAWHWNPEGEWSDPARHQGYWTSSATTTAPIQMSYGYRLPRRGRTVDDANNDGYSRIDDGDTLSFWKTNPYLDPHYTHEAEAAHLQWLVVDLGSAQSVNAARIAWGAPFARRYSVDYWSGDQSLQIDRNPDGEWVTFPRGAVSGALGGNEMRRLGDRPIATRFVRITLAESSHTGAGSDPRDALGFAVRELWLGTIDSTGGFHDVMRHAPSPAAQSEILVSSTDPWHRASDRDTNVAQPGIDLVFGSGLARGRPVLMPTGLLFDTPENAAAEVRYLRNRGLGVDKMELGEEPDGQRVTPEDYAALYRQFASAIHAVDPKVTLGGPSFQTLYNDELRLWPARTSPGKRATWIGRFVDELETHNRLADFGFFSFEWYPFDDICGPAEGHLKEAPVKLVASLERLRAAGLPAGIPMIITEYGYSAHASPIEIDLTGAIFNVETVATLFAHHGSAAYVFGFEPAELMHEPSCPQWGNLAFFLSDPDGRVRDSMPAYWAARMLTKAWADSTGGVHQQVDTHVPLESGTRPPTLGAYTLRRPDGRWSVIVVNRDSMQTSAVAIVLRTAGVNRPLAGPLDIWQYSGAQYQFHADGENGRPSRNSPPSHRVQSRAGASVVLPPNSITVILGH